MEGTSGKHRDKLEVGDKFTFNLNFIYTFNKDYMKGLGLCITQQHLILIRSQF